MSQKFKIKNQELQEIIAGEVMDFPKYTTQLMNLANQNSQGTRPKVVGQMSDLIQEFPERKLKEWEKWYKERKPDAIKNATDKIYIMVEKFKEVIQEIDRDMIEKWVEDLLILKTFMGFLFQDAILKKVAERKGAEYRLATPREESKGIDGYIGQRAVSIKPTTYKQKKSLSETINVEIVYYEKKKDGINIEFNF